MLKLIFKNIWHYPQERGKTQISHLKKNSRGFPVLLRNLAWRKHIHYRDLPYFSCKSTAFDKHKKLPSIYIQNIKGLLKPLICVEVCGKFYTLSEMQSNSYVVMYKREGGKQLYWSQCSRQPWSRLDPVWKELATLKLFDKIKMHWC